jgi:hypothetical protein
MVVVLNRLRSETTGLLITWLADKYHMTYPLADVCHTAAANLSYDLPLIVVGCVRPIVHRQGPVNCRRSPPRVEQRVLGLFRPFVATRLRPHGRTRPRSQACGPDMLERPDLTSLSRQNASNILKGSIACLSRSKSCSNSLVELVHCAQGCDEFCGPASSQAC